MNRDNLAEDLADGPFGPRIVYDAKGNLVSRADYSPDQPRAANGEWGEGGGSSTSGGSSKPTTSASLAHAAEYRKQTDPRFKELKRVARVLRAVPAALGHAVLDEVKEKLADVKESFHGLKHLLTGQRVLPEEKKAIAHVALTIAAALVAGHLTPFLRVPSAVGEHIGEAAEKVTDQILHHFVEKFGKRVFRLDAAGATADPSAWLADAILQSLADAYDQVHDELPPPDGDEDVHDHADATDWTPLVWHEDFDPDQARDEHGRFTDMGSKAARAASKAVETSPGNVYQAHRRASGLHAAAASAHHEEGARRRAMAETDPANADRHMAAFHKHELAAMAHEAKSEEHDAKGYAPRVPVPQDYEGLRALSDRAHEMSRALESPSGGFEGSNDAHREASNAHMAAAMGYSQAARAAAREALHKTGDEREELLRSARNLNKRDAEHTQKHLAHEKFLDGRDAERRTQADVAKERALQAKELAKSVAKHGQAAPLTGRDFLRLPEHVQNAVNAAVQRGRFDKHLANHPVAFSHENLQGSPSTKDTAAVYWPSSAAIQSNKGVNSWDDARRGEWRLNPGKEGERLGHNRIHIVPEASQTGVEGAREQMMAHELSHHLHLGKGGVGWNGGGMDRDITAAYEKRIVPAAKRDAVGDVKPGAWAVSKYATVNPKEWFAETHTAFLYHPKELKKKDPEAYAFMKGVRGQLGLLRRGDAADEADEREDEWPSTHEDGSPDEPRDPTGKWTSGPGGEASGKTPAALKGIATKQSNGANRESEHARAYVKGGGVNAYGVHQAAAAMHERAAAAHEAAGNPAKAQEHRELAAAHVQEAGSPPLGIREAPATEFKSAFDDAFKDSPFASHVTHYSEEQLRGMKTFVTADRKAGIAVHDHGDGRIEGTALFNSGGARGAGTEILAHAITHGGVNYLECYGEKLRSIYEKLGFKVETTSPFNPEYAAATWDYAKFGKPNYYTLKR